MKNWQTVPLKEGRPVNLKIGDLELEVTMVENRWIVGYRYSNQANNKPEYIITRIHLAAPCNVLALKPMMPDRPVVIDFGNPVRIVTGHRVRFLVPIPLWVGILAGNDNNPILMELPSTILSNTWFGDHYSGILSYSLKTHPIVNLNQWSGSSHEALCPVEVFMEAENLFSFRKICLYAHYLNIYRKDDTFWNEGVVVDYPEESEVKISPMERKPLESEGYVQVSQPRINADKNIFEKSMTLLRRYTGL